MNPDEPFFMWYPTIIPHAELIVPEDSIIQKFRGMYPEKPYKGTEPGSPAFRKGGYCSQFHPHATFAAMVYRLDVYVGQIIQKLKDKGLYDNTIIIFASDNGPHMEGGADPDFFNSNGIYRGYKRDLYEGGIRVPMIIPGRGMSNRIRKPTLCALSGMYYRPSKKSSIRKPNRRKWTASACFPSWKTGRDRRNMNSSISNSRN